MGLVGAEGAEVCSAKLEDLCGKGYDSGKVVFLRAGRLVFFCFFNRLSYVLSISKGATRQPCSFLRAKRIRNELASEANCSLVSPE